MQDKDRVVTALPLVELWGDSPGCGATRTRMLSLEELRRRLQAAPVLFVVADVGHPLRWIPVEECHEFWKLEARPHLVDDPERGFDIAQFPDAWCYLASAWESADGRSVVLLERHH